MHFKRSTSDVENLFFASRAILQLQNLYSTNQQPPSSPIAYTLIETPPTPPFYHLPSSIPSSLEIRTTRESRMVPYQEPRAWCSRQNRKHHFLPLQSSSSSSTTAWWCRAGLLLPTSGQWLSWTAKRQGDCIFDYYLRVVVVVADYSRKTASELPTT